MKIINTFLFAAAAFTAAKGFDNNPEITQYTVISKKLPSDFDDFKISFLSDIHSVADKSIADLVYGEKPDIICISGDMTNDKDPYIHFIKLLKKLVKIAPVYLSSGNHDVWRGDYTEFISACRQCGAIYLSNKSDYIYRGQAKIRINGIDDPFARISTLSERNLLASLEKISADDCFNVLLFHRADMFDLLADKGFDLILSGHMHGGLIRTPFTGGFVCPKTNLCAEQRVFFPKYSGGEYTKCGTKMIVSRGTGKPSSLPRFFNRPELCTITLKNYKSV